VSDPCGNDPAELEQLRIENARLRARLEQQVRGQRELVQGLANTQQLGAILKTSLEHAIAISAADSGGVFTLSEDGTELLLAAHHGLSPRLIAEVRTVPTALMSVRTVLDGASISRTVEQLQLIPMDVWLAEGLTCMLVLPFMHGSRVLGVLALVSHSLDRIPADAEGALGLLASQLGSAIARAQAKAEQALLARVVESSIVSIGLADLDGVATYVNPALVRTWGHTDSQAMIGGSVLDWWADRDAAKSILAQIFERGSVTSELLARRADGSTFPAVGTACLIHTPSGAPSHMMGSFIDLTEINQARDALRQVRLADAINGLLRRALEGEDERRLGHACVRVALELTGASTGLLACIDADGALGTTYAVGQGLVEVPGQGSFADLTPGRTPPRGLWAHAIAKSGPFYCNEPADHPAAVGTPPGHPPIDNVLYVPMNSDGERRAVLALGNREGGFDDDHLTAAVTLAPVIRQVLDYRRSERARLESEQRVHDQDLRLRRGQKLEAIGRLAGGVAHDFNNLLAVVTLFGQSLVAALEPGSELAEDAQAIVETADRGARLTRQLLAFGRRTVLQPVHQQAGALVLEMESIIRRLLGDGVELVVDAEAGQGWIHADPGEMGQVLMNLAVNARDAMPQGGRLTITVVDRVPLDGLTVPDLPVGDYVELRVEDTGIGMSAAQLEHIFEPFYTTKAQGKGTGLGLATVYGIVKQTGGSVKVLSSPGRGTAFHIYLPRAHSAERPAPPPPVPTVAAGGGQTILLAEDDAQVRRGAARVLRQAGYQVLEAANAGEALLIAEQHVGAVHVLVSDVDMPRISGPRLARRLKLARPSLRVLFVTGHGGQHLDVAELSGDGARVLSKPFAAQELTSRIRALLDE